MFSVSYNPTSDTPRKTSTICLNMIVKNESRIILRLLNTVVPLIDAYCICDTGSTDNTVELIETFMREHHITGKIVSEPFRDFGYNRTFALNEAVGMGDYILLLDADMYLSGDALSHPHEFKRSLTKDCYHVCQGSPTYFYKNVRIVRNNKGYSYWGVTHEYVVTPEGTEYGVIENATLFIQDVGDGGAKTDKFERDIRLLSKGLEEHPNNDRYTFYLANSLRDAGRVSEAINMYKSRIAIGGWIEEVWYSYYNMGKCYATLGEHEKAISTWMEAYDHHPKRIENLYEIINYYRLRGKNRLAYSFYIMANESNRRWGANVDYLFLQKDVYDYKIDYELTIIGYYVNDSNIDLLKTSMKVLAYEYLSEDIATNILSNYKFYRKQISLEQTNRLSSQQQGLLNRLCDGLNIDPAFVKSTPSIIRRENHLIINTRFVNYRINENGGYVNASNVTTKNAISVVDISNPLWKLVQEFELKYDTSKDGYYIGLEDIRLAWNGTHILYNANRGMPDGKMRVEHGTISLVEETTENSTALDLDSGNNSTEKNWVLFPSATPSIKCVYHWNPTFSVGDIVENRLHIRHNKDVPYFFRFLRGSTNGVLIHGEVWFICHAVSYEDRRYYYHIVVVVDPHTYEIKRYTSLFTFEGSHVEYTLGFIYLDDEDHLLIGYSLYDKTAKYIQLPRTFFEQDMTVPL